MRRPDAVCSVRTTRSRGVLTALWIAVSGWASWCPWDLLPRLLLLGIGAPLAGHLVIAVVRRAKRHHWSPLDRRWAIVCGFGLGLTIVLEFVPLVLMAKIKVEERAIRRLCERVLADEHCNRVSISVMGTSFTAVHRSEGVVFLCAKSGPGLFDHGLVYSPSGRPNPRSYAARPLAVRRLFGPWWMYTASL